MSGNSKHYTEFKPKFAVCLSHLTRDTRYTYNNSFTSSRADGGNYGIKECSGKGITTRNDKLFEYNILDDQYDVFEKERR